jgi:hypothetical protein
MINKNAYINQLNIIKAMQNEDTVYSEFKDPLNIIKVFSGIKTFFVDDDYIKYLTPKYTKNNVGLRKLPYNKILIPNTVYINNNKINGVVIVDGFCNIKQKNTVFVYFVKSVNNDISQLYTTNIEGDKTIREANNTIDPELAWNKEDKKLCLDVGIFVCNFLDFLNNPDIVIRDISRTEKQNKKRIKRNKFPINKHKYVIIKGELKNYFDNLKNDVPNNSYTHSFWVRGHFRQLKNKRYKDKIGHKIWIPPYIKGKGILVDKKYFVRGLNDES